MEERIACCPSDNHMCENDPPLVEHCRECWSDWIGATRLQSQLDRAMELASNRLVPCPFKHYDDGGEEWYKKECPDGWGPKACMKCREEYILDGK